MKFRVWNLVLSEDNRVWSLDLRTIGYGIKLSSGDNMELGLRKKLYCP